MSSKCVFCTVNEGIVSPVESAPKICSNCVYELTLQQKNFPFGSIYCNKCSSIGGFVVYYPGDVKVGFAHTGLDRRKEAIYSVVAVRGAWTKQKSPEKCVCGHCKAPIPLWMLDKNYYVKTSST